MSGSLFLRVSIFPALTRFPVSHSLSVPPVLHPRNEYHYPYTLFFVMCLCAVRRVPAADNTDNHGDADTLCLVFVSTFILQSPVPLFAVS